MVDVNTRQDWQRFGDTPALWLGPMGAFDDMHLLTPCVAREGGRYWMWYAGSGGDVAGRQYSMGLASSDDGVTFAREVGEPVFVGPQGQSILEMHLLRRLDGSPLRIDGQLQMWTTAVSSFAKDQPNHHTLHHMVSDDGRAWERFSQPLLEHVYSPSVWLDEAAGLYHLWYVHVEGEPWHFRHAVSEDGFDWRVDAQPCLELGQAWEHERIFYPHVVKQDGRYLMWYGAYWAGQPAMMTALGFAVSDDGVTWRKSEQNPVYTPEPSHAWESHYTTSHTVFREPDGTWRLWYASREKPPYVHKYFAIGAARWREG